MLLRLGHSAHNCLLSQFPRNRRLVGRVYAAGVMATIVLVRVSFKIGAGKLTSELPGDGLFEHARGACLQLLHAPGPVQAQSAGGLDQKFEIVPRSRAALWENWKLGWAIATAMLLTSFGLKMIPLSVYAIIMNLKPVLVMVLGILYGVETVTAKKAGLILLSFLGTALIVDPQLFASALNWGLGTRASTASVSAETRSADGDQSSSIILGPVYYSACALTLLGVLCKAYTFVSIKKSSAWGPANGRRRVRQVPDNVLQQRHQPGGRHGGLQSAAGYGVVRPGGLRRGGLRVDGAVRVLVDSELQ